MQKIYVVMGSTGEYSDSHDWPVFGFRNKKEAEDYAELAHIESLKIKNKCMSKDAYYGYDPDEHGTNPYDAGMSMDYTGTFYSVMEVKLK